MTTNEKGRNGGNRATRRHDNNSTDYIKPSPIGRKQKRGWKRGRK